MRWDPTRHWRSLTLACLAALGLAFALPGVVEAPRLRENRKLAQAPAAPRNWTELRTWPKAADAYVTDRFPARPHLIGGLNYLRYRLGVSGSERVVVGRDGWLFYDSGDHFAVTRNDPVFSDTAARAWLKGFAGRSEWLAAHGARYVVLLAPDKEATAPQHGPAWFAGPDADRAAALLGRLNAAAAAGELVDPAPRLQRQTRSGVNVYNAVETHWTGLGAYTGYVALMQRLHAMGLTEGPRPLAAFRRAAEGARKPRNLSLMLGVASFVDADYPEFEDPAVRPRITYLTASRHWTSPQLVDTGQHGKPVLLLMRDSFSLALLPFLQGHFSRIVIAHNQDGAWRPDLVARFRPDVVVTEVVESGAPFIMTPAPPASPTARARVERALATPHRGGRTCREDGA